MNLSIVPRAGFVLIRPIAPARPRAGNIELADWADDEAETSGQVIALAERFACPQCGDGREPEVQIGDVVVFPPSAGQALEWEGERFLLIPEEAISAVVEEVAAGSG